MPQSSDARNPEIDRILDQWAVKNGFDVQAIEHWDAVTRRVAILDSGGDLYQIYAGRNYDKEGETTGDAREVAIAGADLVRRGGSKHLAFRREREKFTFRSTTPLSQLSRCLDQAYVEVQRWVSQAGHSLNPKPLSSASPSDA